MSRTLFAVPARRAAAGSVLLALAAGCYPGSDAEVASRQARREREERLREMRAATRTTPAGAPLGAGELAAAVPGSTHVFEYESRPDGRRGRYVEWYWFAPGGQLVYLNTLWAGDRAGRPEDRWRLDGGRLCVLNTWMSQEEQCYRLARRDDGRLQYVFAMPGSDTDGLLTRVTDAVIAGPPPPSAGPG